LPYTFLILREDIDRKDETDVWEIMDKVTSSNLEVSAIIVKKKDR
jgi:hypothetical protein